MSRRVCPRCGFRYGREALRCALDGSALEALPDPLRGRLLGQRYRVGEELGAGAMGTVYEGDDVRAGSPVAIKVPDAEALGDEVLRERFLREGRVGMALRHPHVAATLDVGCDGDTHYLVMERLYGETLAARLARGAPPIATAVSWARQLADALDALHARGVVHRDVKPSNVFLDARAEPARCVKLLDLGVARDAGDDALTASRAVLGSARTMAPEQARGERATAASDLYSLGAVLFELLTGGPVFRGNDVALRRAHFGVAPPRARSLRGDVSDDLDELVDVLLAKSPAQRPVSAAHVRDRLDALAAEGPDEATRMAPPTERAADDLDAAVDPARVAEAHAALNAVVARWGALGPALDALTRLRASEAELRRVTLALAQLPRDAGDATRRRAELAAALADEERGALVEALRGAGVSRERLREGLEAAARDAEGLALALRRLCLPPRA